MRLITNDTSEASKLIPLDQTELRETRILPTSVKPFGAAQAIYGNKVAQYSVKGELFALVVEHPSLAYLQRTIFNMAWDLASSKEK